MATPRALASLLRSPLPRDRVPSLLPAAFPRLSHPVPPPPGFSSPALVEYATTAAATGAPTKTQRSPSSKGLTGKITDEFTGAGSHCDRRS
ncbi:hypothetical protein OPV22_015320 [Ensete ventricosum]|uniref:Uncharacterized protein n=1 Tax=Ensete ventricosum TaxID=4639 RepID=A0AAV8PLE4_ENSVE|nr:hypothetical protein OPV22_015320 [Ensete ventricosum]